MPEVLSRDATPIPDGSTTVRTIESFDDAASLAGDWDGLVSRCGGDIYQTFDWCRIWWQRYGARRRLLILAGFADDRLVAVLPAFIETLWLGPVRIRVAKLLGSDFSLQFCHPTIEPGHLAPFLSRAISLFLGDHACDLLLLGPLSGPQARMGEMQTVAQAQAGLVQAADCVGVGSATRIDLPENMDAYLKAVGSRQRGNYTRALKQFSGACKVQTDVVSEPAEVVAEFPRFAALHEEQWRADGMLGHFGDWPGSLDFNRELVKTFGRQNKVRFFRIIADGKVASSQYAFVHGGVNYWRLPARHCEPAWEKYSLGRMGLIRMIEDSLREGVRAIEGGRGHYDYKLQLGGREWPLRTLQIMRHGAAVRHRVRLFLALARCLHMSYYRVFFLRLGPRLPWLRGPLWPLWIRSTW